MFRKYQATIWYHKIILIVSCLLTSVYNITAEIDTFSPNIWYEDKVFKNGNLQTAFLKNLEESI